MDMVERVAFAIAKARRDAEGQVRPSQLYEHLARAAIAAMREPTPQMLDAGANEFRLLRVDNFEQDVWDAMIDAALTSSEPQG